MQEFPRKIIYRCDYCNLPYVKREDLLGHFVYHEQKKGDRRYRCARCYMFFPSLKNLREHGSSHHKGKKFTCDECYRKFVTEASYRIHKTAHQENKNYSSYCESCERLLSSKRSLAVHKCRKYNAPALLCDLCRKIFHGEDDFYQHRLTVHPALTFKCDHCSALGAQTSQFRDKRSLAQHIREMHTKSYQCDSCFQKFGSKSNLALHLSKPHKAHKCPLCPETFESLRNFVDHRNVAHANERKEYHCPRCKKTYLSPKGLKLHERTCGKVICYLCGALFDSEVDVWFHLHRVHGQYAAEPVDQESASIEDNDTDNQGKKEADSENNV